jgi:hypothetical protein
MQECYQMGGACPACGCAWLRARALSVTWNERNHENSRKPDNLGTVVASFDRELEDCLLCGVQFCAPRTPLGPLDAPIQAPKTAKTPPWRPANLQLSPEKPCSCGSFLPIARHFADVPGTIGLTAAIGSRLIGRIGV